MRREEELVTGEIYHIFNTSIADFKIFLNDTEHLRMINLFRYYQIENMPVRFSRFIELHKDKKEFYKHFITASGEREKLVQIIKYCVMPTHIHLILKQLKEMGISIFMGNIQNSYSRYFNTKLKRKGPLWVGKFKNLLVKTNEQLLHLTRYIHLNPVTAYLVDKPEDWSASSYKEFLLEANDNKGICEYNRILDIKPTTYRKFVEDRVSYQRELAKIKKLIIE